MISHFSNFLILKSHETNEEHLAKIIDFDMENKKIRLSLVDEEKNVYYTRNKSIKIIVPTNKDIYSFETNILNLDVIERIITIQYPENIEVVHKRKYKRYSFNFPIEVVMGDTTFTSITMDISIGGLSFAIRTTKICQVEDYVKINFSNTTPYLGGLWLKIVNHRESLLNNQNVHIYGGEFEDLDSRMLNQLIVFLNENDIKSHS